VSARPSPTPGHVRRQRITASSRLTPPPDLDALAAAGVLTTLKWWDQHPVEGDPALVEHLVLSLVAAIRHRLAGLSTPPDLRLAPELAQRLVRSFRTELLAVWAEPGLAPPRVDVVLRTLQALDEIGDVLLAEWGDSPIAVLGETDLLLQVAHDLRSPLASILFLAETLQKELSGSVSPLQHRQLGLIYSAALGLSSLASDAMEMARGSSHLTELDPVPFSVTEVLEGVRDIVHPVAEEKGLEVRLTPPEVDRRIGFPVEISRVLLNLTTNALKFTETGFVEIATESRGHRGLEFSVRDSGPGMAPESVPNLFRPLRPSAGTAKLRFSGTGLGLAICRRLVRAMGAELLVDTRRGWGTRFSFTIELSIAAGPQSNCEQTPTRL